MAENALDSSSPHNYKWRTSGRNRSSLRLSHQLASTTCHPLGPSLVQNDDPHPYPHRRDPKGENELFASIECVIADDNGGAGGAQIRDVLRATFKSGVTRPLAWRKHQLYQVARLAQNEADAVCEALTKDFSKPRVEVLMTEIGPIVERATKSAEQLDEWAASEHPEVPDWQKGWKPT